MHEKAFQADLDTIDLRKKPHTNAWNGIIKSADTVHRLLSSQMFYWVIRDNYNFIKIINDLKKLDYSIIH